MAANENETHANRALQGLGAAPFFLVKDVVKAAEYYHAKLGFDKVSVWGEPPCFAIVTLGKANIMLSQTEQPLPITPNYGKDGSSWDAYVWITDTDAHYASCQAAGAKIVRELEDAPYGLREFDVMDADGYVVCFGAELG